MTKNQEMLLRRYWRRLPDSEREAILFLDSRSYPIFIKGLRVNSKHQLSLDIQNKNIALLKLKLYKSGSLRKVASPRSKDI